MFGDHDVRAIVGDSDLELAVRPEVVKRDRREDGSGGSGYFTGVQGFGFGSLFPGTTALRRLRTSWPVLELP